MEWPVALNLFDVQLAVLNPVSGVKRPKTGNAGIGAGMSPSLTPKQVRSMLDTPDTGTLQGLRGCALLHIYFYTGARCSEPGRLKVKDLKYDREYTVLDLTIKGNKRNSVAIHPECARVIRKYLDASEHRQNPEAFFLQPMYNGKTGKPLNRIQCYRLFNKCTRLAGLPAGVYPHVARATIITEAYATGVAGEAIQRTVHGTIGFVNKLG